MKTAREIVTDVREVLSTRWATRNGIVVPEPEDVTLGNDAVRLEGTVLYADMADSTALVDGFKDWFAAKIYKSYLVAASHIVRKNSGDITAFDGDRIMAVYVGDGKNSAAAKTALQLNWAVTEINAALKREYPNTAFQLKHSVGIDTSTLFVAKTGIRNSNDLVWVGRAANYAAKLCALDSGAIITKVVFDKLSDASKYGGNPRRVMWDKFDWEEKGISIYKSTWTWEP